MKNSSIIFSNRVEELYEELKGRLFSPQTAPFAQRLILVPSPAMRSWLLLRMADDPDLRVCAGVEIRFLEQGLSQLDEKLHSGPERKPLPPELLLSLRIEQELASLFSEEEPLRRYLQAEKGVPLGARSRKRLTSLSKKCAHLFGQYGRYGAKMIEGWGEEAGWQRLLWQRLFEKGPWSPHYARVEAFVPKSCPGLSVHLFANSYLSPLQHRFLLKVAEKAPVHYYFLSPCQAFWSDIRSTNERRALKKYWEKRGCGKAQVEALDSYLRDCNPLLANYGKVGREMALRMEDFESRSRYAVNGAIEQEECYCELLHDEIAMERGKPLTLLEALQADLVLMRNPADAPPIAIEEGESIQLHLSSNRKREVENLHDTLLGIVDKGAASPREIIVLAPDINEYAPYIKTVFGKESSPLDYQIMDLKSAADNPLVRGFLKLLALPFGRWEAQELLELFEIEPFLKQIRMNREELLLVRGWTEKMGVRWGCDAAQRDNLLLQHHCKRGMVEKSELGTWEEAFKQLVLQLAGGGGDISITEAETLGKWAKAIRGLRRDLEPVTSALELTVREWVEYLEALFESYFGEEEKGKEAMAPLFRSFEKAASQLGEALFPFSTLKIHLEESLLSEQTCYREGHLQAVRFCSMLPMRAVPAKAIVLLGMDEGAFPKRDLLSSLNLLSTAPEADFCPSQRDYDRYLFLEMLLSARSFLILSYVAADESGNKERPPSLLITELFQYLDSSYRIDGELPSKKCRLLHPFHNFDAAYFPQESSPLHSYSAERFAAAQAFYCRKEPPRSFIPSFAQAALPADAGEQVEIKELEGAARNPLKSYFNRKLGIYLKESQTTGAASEEDFELSFLDKSMLVRNSLRKGLAALREEKKFPLGLFKGLATLRIERELAELTTSCAKLQVDGAELFDIEFLPHCKRLEQLGDSLWQAPPLQVGSRQVVGTLKQLSPHGLVAYQEDAPKESFRAWPLFLVYLSALKTLPLEGKPQLLLIKKDKAVAKPAPAENPLELLDSFISYAFKAREEPSPLLPEWIEPLLQGDQAELQKAIDEAVAAPGYNHYLDWCWQEGAAPSSQELIDRWREEALSLFGSGYALWYPEEVKNEAL